MTQVQYSVDIIIHVLCIFLSGQHAKINVKYVAGYVHV